jgi:hypothetical protein
VRRILVKTSLILVFAVAASARAQDASKGASAKAQEPAVQLTIAPLPAEATRRFQRFQGVLQPTAKAWIEQQARTEAQRSAPDLAALRVAIRQRFANQKRPADTNVSASAANLQDMDIDTMVFIVLTQAANDQQSDLQDMMGQQQAIANEKQQLRQLLDEVNQQAAQTGKSISTESCKTSLCQTLPARLEPLSAAALPRPVRIRIPEHLTYDDLAGVQSQLKQSQDSLSDMSQGLQLKMQMAQQAYTQCMEAISNVMKTVNDSENGIIANMK